MDGDFLPPLPGGAGGGLGEEGGGGYRPGTWVTDWAGQMGGNIGKRDHGVPEGRNSMPWEEATRMNRREQFVAAFDSCQYTMTELCERYGISRKTGYKW